MTPSNAKLNMPGEGCGQGAMSSPLFRVCIKQGGKPGECSDDANAPSLRINSRGDRVCNLYSITTNQAAIIALFRVINHYVGNLPPMPGVFPDYPAPVVRDDGGGREMVTMRWGMPPPPRAGGYPVTNIRNTSSPHWRGWLKPESRCLVPSKKLRRVRARVEPSHRQEGRGVVRAP